MTHATTLRPFVTEAGTRAVQALLNQGDFGINKYGSCMYYADGKSCALGLLFRSIGLTTDELEGMGGTASQLLANSSVVSMLPDQWQHLTPMEVSYLQGLQSVHDQASHARNVFSLPEALRDVARRSTPLNDGVYIGYAAAYRTYMEILNEAA